MSQTIKCYARPSERTVRQVLSKLYVKLKLLVLFTEFCLEIIWNDPNTMALCATIGCFRCSTGGAWLILAQKLYLIPVRELRIYMLCADINTHQAVHAYSVKNRQKREYCRQQNTTHRENSENSGVMRLIRLWVLSENIFPFLAAELHTTYRSSSCIDYSNSGFVLITPRVIMNSLTFKDFFMHIRLAGCQWVFILNRMRRWSGSEWAWHISKKRRKKKWDDFSSFFMNSGNTPLNICIVSRNNTNNAAATTSS